MKRTEVQKLYHIAGAKWYDTFKKVWNALVAGKAEKVLNKFLKENIKSEMTILELGPGTALNLQKIHYLNLPFKSYEGWDFSDDMLTLAKRKFKSSPNVRFKKQDLTHIQMVARKFDVIICTWVLSHLDEPSKLVNQAQSLLNANGKMFFVFLGKPKGWAGGLIGFFSKYIFAAKPVDRNQIKQFNNIKWSQKSLGGFVTILEISPTSINS